MFKLFPRKGLSDWHDFLIRVQTYLLFVMEKKDLNVNMECVVAEWDGNTRPDVVFAMYKGQIQLKSDPDDTQRNKDVIFSPHITNKSTRLG